MLKKNFIKLNINDNYLSFGNVCRIIKEESNCKNTFLQSDLFCILFNTDSIADSTVNNYCTGFRAINTEYKNVFLYFKNQYTKDNYVLLPLIIKILSLLDNTVYSDSKININFVNSNLKLFHICSRLYSISKNDSDININFSNKLYQLLEKHDLYTFMVLILFYVILDKKQPIFVEESFSNVIEKKIYDTNISVKDIENFIDIQLNSGIWSIRAITELAKTGNPFACFELASLEYYGMISDTPRYEYAYKYYLIAAEHNHPVANWAIGYMYYNGLIGCNSKHDKYLSLKYFNRARKLRCSNAYNNLGMIIQNGNFPHIKPNTSKAIEFFNQAISLGNVYAYNNIGKIYECKKDYKNAFEYFLIAANNNESWACNKIGEYYRNGFYCKKDLKKAFEYYTKSSESSKFTLCSWSKYNLAKYFYENGALDIGVSKDINKAITLLEQSSEVLIESIKELIYIYYTEYIKFKSNCDLLGIAKKSDLLNKLNYWINKIEHHANYDDILKKEIEQKLKNIKKEISHIQLP